MKPLHWDSNEIDPFTGQKYTWDSPNPNVTWDGIREPGDPGYIPPPLTPTAGQPRKTKRKMKHNSFYPTNVPEQIIWLTNFFNKLIGHATALGVSPAVCAAAVADSRWLIYLMGSYQPALKAWAKSNTDTITEAKIGTGDAVMTLPVFIPPPLPPADVATGLPAVIPTKPGALTRIFSLVQVMQESPSYTEALATDMGTIGTQAAGPDFETIQPTIKVKIIGGQVFIDWGWGGFSAYLDLLQLQVDRGQGWADLAYDTTPGYTDTQPFPAALTTWKYRAIYRVGDNQVGVWSAEVGIAVGG
jgi:hypothetical protein